MTNGKDRTRFVKDTFGIMSSSSEPRVFPLPSSGLDDYPSPHSPTDSSEDSVEVRVSPICPAGAKNKRKCAEPRRVQDFCGPLKKRVCLKVRSEAAEAQPFRPWSEPEAKARRAPSPEQPVALVKREEAAPMVVDLSKVKSEPCPSRPEPLRVPVHPHPSRTSTSEAERMILASADAFPRLQQQQQQQQRPQPACGGSRKEQRNYKNMTRERRIEANARERTRVHTISAAFDTLRRSVPSYSHNQKLSKLSVLRIACSYIMTLTSELGGSGGGVGGEEVPPVAECTDLVTRTIQREGKLRKKKDEAD